MTQNNKKHKKRGIYSLLTRVLLIALVQALRGAFLNVENFFSLSKKIEKLQEIHQNSMEQNELLKRKIAEFRSMQGVEDIARNELKMAGKDEVLVLIKDKQAEEASD